MPDKESKQSKLINSLTELQNKANELEKIFVELLVHLEPVLAPNSKLKAGAVLDTKKENPNSEAINRIADVIDNLEQTRNNISETIDRLQT